MQAKRNFSDSDVVQRLAAWIVKAEKLNTSQTTMSVKDDKEELFDSLGLGIPGTTTAASEMFRFAFVKVFLCRPLHSQVHEQGLTSLLLHFRCNDGGVS